MSKRTLLAAVCLAWAAAAFAVDPLDRVFETLQPGQRVEVRLKNGSLFRGEILLVDSGRIALDVSLENPSLLGSLVLQREQINRVTVLSGLSDVEREVQERRREKYRESVTAKEAAPSETAEAPPETPEEAAQEAAPKPPGEDLEKLKALVALFPPAEGWGEERRADILARSARTEQEQAFLDRYSAWLDAKTKVESAARLDLAKRFSPDQGWGPEKYERLSNQFIVLGVPLTAEEQEFVDNFKDWEKGVEEAAKAAEEAQKAAPPAGAVEEKPAEEGAGEAETETVPPAEEEGD